MQFLKNLTENTPLRCVDLVSVKPCQIVSMALSAVDNASVTAFALAAGETISEETYPGDTLYQVLSGELHIQWETGHCAVSAGEILPIPADQLHALRAEQDTKLIQITLSR